MKRTFCILVILAMMLAVSGVASAATYSSTIGSDPNALLPWEDGSNWNTGVAPTSADQAIIQTSDTAYDNVTTFNSFMYLNSPTEIHSILLGHAADNSGKLHVGPAGVLTSVAPSYFVMANVGGAGTLVNEGTINCQATQFARTGPCVIRFIGDSVFNATKDVYSRNWFTYGNSLDFTMTDNAKYIVNTTDRWIMSHPNADDLTMNLYDNAEMTINAVNMDPKGYGQTSLNNNATLTHNGRHNNPSLPGTIDINDNAVMNFAGSHGQIDNTTVNINGGTLMTSAANTVDIRNGIINVSGGALLCGTAVPRPIYNDNITLSGTGIINGWTKVWNGSFAMTGGKLGCGLDASVTPLNNNGGALAPNIDEVGTMTIGGDATQSSTASIEIDLGGTAPGEFDTVSVSGTLYLNGTLDVTFVDGFESTIADGDSFIVVQAADIDGTFTNIDATSYITVNQGGTDYEFFVAISDTQVTLTYSADGNAAPIADAGDDFTVEDPNEDPIDFSLAGSYLDDGRPIPPTYTSTWSLVSSPAGSAVTIDSVNTLATDVNIDTYGSYVFKLEVSDSDKTGESTVTVLYTIPPFCPAGPLLVHYEFEGNYADSTVNAQDLIASGPSASISADAAVGDESLYLGGSTYLTRPGQSFCLEDGDEVTLSYWVKENPANPSDGWGCMFANGRDMDNNGDGMNDYGICLLRPDAGRFKWQPGQFAHQYNNGADNDGDTVADPSVSDGSWHMVSCTYDKVAGASQIYIDGELKSSASGFVGGLDAPYDPAIVIGTNGQGATPADWKYFKGNIDDVRVYNTVLTAAEIAALIPVDCPMDLNGDGVVALDDITEIVLVIKDAPGYSVPAAVAPAMDLNGDGSVALDDITEIVLVIKDAPGYSVDCP